MYIKLGNIETSLTYNEGFNDFMIIAGVVPDCQMSYEKPILVRNKRDLLLWFGENNTEQVNQQTKFDKKETFKKEEIKNPAKDKRLQFLFDDDD